MQTGRQDMKLRPLIVSAAGVCLGCARLLKVDLRAPLLRPCQDVLTLNEKSTLTVFNFEVRLAVGSDVLNVLYSRGAEKIAPQMMLRNAPTHRRVEPKRPGDDVQDFSCR